MTDKLKVGIIGCGGIANQKHLPALSKQNNKCEIIAFCDIIPERANAACTKFGAEGAKVYATYQELIADSTIDLVHILTPNVTHCPITVAAFEAGKHVMCEKPMAHSTEDAQMMLDAWKKSGKKFTIGYQNRFRKDTRTLHDACAKGELGEIYFAKAHAVRRKAVPTWGVFPNKALQGGGPLIDIGTHALDLTLWMMENYKPISCSGSVFQKIGKQPEGPMGNMFGPWDPKTYEVEDSAFGFVKMENGATIFLEASWALNVKDSREAATTLCGTKAGAELIGGMSKGGEYELIINKAEHNALMEERISEGGSVAFFGSSSNAPEDLECVQWLDAIINNTEPLCKPEQAFVVTQILDGIYKAAASGKEFFFNEK